MRPIPCCVALLAACGSTTGYQVSILELVNDGGATDTALVVNLFTTRTSVRVPPQRLVAGHLYMARIRAVISPGASVETAPLRRGLSESSAQVMTSPFSP